MSNNINTAVSAITAATTAMKNLAITAANSGNYVKAYSFLTSIRNLDQKFNISALRQEIDNIKANKTNDKISGLLQDALNCAGNGNERQMTAKVMEAKRLADTLGINITSQMDEILAAFHNGILKTLDEALTEAMQFAQAADPKNVGKKYGFIKSWFDRLSEEEQGSITEKFNEIFRTLKNCCRTQTDIMLEAAGVLFDNNQTAEASNLISAAQNLADAAKINISARVAEVQGKRPSGGSLNIPTAVAKDYKKAPKHAAA